MFVWMMRSKKKKRISGEWGRGHFLRFLKAPLASGKFICALSYPDKKLTMQCLTDFCYAPFLHVVILCPADEKVGAIVLLVLFFLFYPCFKIIIKRFWIAIEIALYK